MTLTPSTNRLIAALPGKDRAHFLSKCTSVELDFAEILEESGAHIRAVYFPTESFITLIEPMEGHAGLVVALVGNEGMLGISLVMGVEFAPQQALVRGQGNALRMDATVFIEELKRQPALEKILKQYSYVVMGKIAQSAVCTHYHVVEARLACWLLMSQDRAHSNQFSMTQKSLAYILGVRRVGISNAASALQKRQLISYSRGVIRILDRPGLEAASCSCYKADLEAHKRTMG